MSTDYFIPREGARIGILGKGGAGKSTVCVLLARGLRQAGFPVAVLNADATNVGLHRALGIAHQPRGLLEHLGGPVFTGGAVTCPVDDPAPLLRAEIDVTALDPGYVGRTANGICLLEGGHITDGGPGAGCDGPVAKIARDIRVFEAGRPMLLLVDFKAGLEDVARGVITGLDAAVAVVDPTQVSIDLVWDLCGVAEAIRAGALPASRHLEDPSVVDLYNRLYANSALREVMVVLNRIDSEGVAKYLRMALTGARARILGSIPEHRGIANAWLHGRALEPPVEAATILRALIEGQAARDLPA